MRRSLILALFCGFPCALIAQDGTFDDSLLISNIIFATSQHYQIQKLNCEVAGVFTVGNLESKQMDRTMEVKSQGSEFHCGQRLAPDGLIIGVKGDMGQYMMDGVVERYESLWTTYLPYLVFELAPSVSLSFSTELSNAENKSLTVNVPESSQRMLMSGSYHEGPWEVTLSYADRYRNSDHPGLDIARSMGLGLRYQLSRQFAAGFIYSKIDHPGVSYRGNTKEFEQNYLAVFQSRIDDSLSLDLSYLNTVNGDGYKDVKGQTIGLTGQYAVNSTVKVAAFVQHYNGEEEEYDTTVTAYGFSLSLQR